MTEEEAEMADDDEIEGSEDHEAPDAEEPEAEAEAGEEAVEAEPAEETSEEEPEDGLEAGDFVRLSYTAHTVESGQLVDTTDRETAREEGIDEEDRDFGPRVIVLGEGHLFSTVDDELIGKAVGDEGTVVVDAEDAFGEKDPDDVRTISVEKIPEDDRYPGAHVTIEGEHGHVETVIGGRARVDFNHPLAGQDVEYEYEIVEEVTDRLEQAKGLFGMYVDADPEMWIQVDEEEEEVTVFPDDDEYDPEKAPDPETPEDEDEEAEGEDEEAQDDEEEEPEPQPYTETQTVEKETLYIEADPQLAMNQQWLFSKQQIGRQIIDRLDLDRIIVQEVIDYTSGGMGGMFGGMGMGGMGGGDVEEALEDADVDADEIVEELDSE